MLIGRVKGMNWQLRVTLSACLYMPMIFIYMAHAQRYDALTTRVLVLLIPHVPCAPAVVLSAHLSKLSNVRAT
jgi:hypothetical protein